MLKGKKLNPKDIEKAKSTTIKLLVAFLALAAVTWFLIYYSVQIDYTTTQTNETTPMFHILAQNVPTIVNGIATVTSIALGFSVAFIGIIARELLNDDKYQLTKRYLIGNYLFVFPSLLLLLGSAYIFQLIGGVFIKSALEFAFISLIFAILWITAIFVLIEPIIKQQDAKSKNPIPNDKRENKSDSQISDSKDGNKMANMSDKPNEPNDKVLELINWIEEKKPEIIKWDDSLSGTFWLVTIFFIAIAWITGFTVHDYVVSIAIGIAGFSGLIAYFSFFIQTSQNRVLEKRFARLKKMRNSNDTDTVLLRALIKIRRKNEDISLKTLYMMDKEAKGDIFTEKKLIEIFYK